MKSKLIFSTILLFSHSSFSQIAGESVAETQRAISEAEIPPAMVMPPMTGLAVNGTAAQMANERCAKVYFDFSEGSNKSKFDLSGFYKGIYGGNMKDQMKLSTAENVVGTAILTLAAPLLWLVGKSDRAIARAAASQAAAMGRFIVQNEDRKTTEINREMYNKAKKYFSISAEEFLFFVRNQMNGSEFCELKDQLVLTDAGKQVLGDRDFLVFARTTEGSREWEDFWNNPANYTSMRVLRPIYEAEEHEKILLKQLRDKGFAEAR